MANNNISLKFALVKMVMMILRFIILILPVSIATLKSTLRNGGHVTFINFDLYRGNIAKEVNNT